MRILFLALTTFLIFSCNSRQEIKTTTESKSKESQVKPDFNVAIKFINDYAEFCTPKSPPSNDSNWVEQNPLLTDHFKTTYKNLLDSANKEDPELGLDFDPIFDGQDFPDKGFELLSCDTNTGDLIVRGKDWPEFVVAMRIVNQNNKWLVDGSGIINIPKDKIARKN